MSYKSSLIHVAIVLCLENLCGGQNLNSKILEGGDLTILCTPYIDSNFAKWGKFVLGNLPPRPLNGTLSIYVRYTLACVQTYMHSLSSDIIDIIGIYSNMYSINVHDMQFPIPEFSMETLLLCSLHCTSTSFIFFTRDLIKI